jgi:hypothetical protein
MQTQRFISTVDQVMEHPEVWTQRLAKSKWGDRIPHMERSAHDGDTWVVDGRRMSLSAIANVGALMTDRTAVPKRWEDVSQPAYVPAERLRTMDADSVAYSVLYPSFAGFSGETFGALTDSDLELACVQAYNDWLLDEWSSYSERFIPQCIVPLAPVEAAVTEVKRAVGRGHKGVVFPALPMHLRDVPHINSVEYDPIWATCQDLEVPLCFHAGSSRQLQFPVAPTLSPELASALQAVTRPASAVFDLVNLLSEIESGFCREHHRLGNVYLGICRPSVRTGPLRLRIETFGDVQKTVLPDRLVRSGQNQRPPHRDG